MSSHPVNLVVRFLLELAALVALGMWGWAHGEGWTAFLLVLLVPGIAATLWGTFRVPDDPGRAPVVVPGIVRLLLEGAFFLAALLALCDIHSDVFALLLGFTVLVHYATSYDRVMWLLAGAQPRSGQKL